MSDASVSSTTQLPEALRRAIVETVARHLVGRSYRLYLFGSRAQGRATPRSDYDLAVLGEGAFPLAQIERLRGDLEGLPVLQRVELVDLGRSSADFMGRVLGHAVLLDEH